jgi:hypothetical protein
MKTLPQRLLAGLSAAATALLVACGGGGTSGSDSAPAAQYEGTISGFGSVFVNGVRFDDKRAVIKIDDEVVAVGSLRLGMRVALAGAVAAAGDIGEATSVSVETGARGAVASINTGAGTFRIRHITIQTDAQTVFEGTTDLSTLKAGDWVETHGAVDFANRVLNATRVEVKPPEEVGRMVLFGAATGVTATSFTLGDLSVSYAGAQLIGFDNGVIPEGAIVRVRSSAAPVNNVLTATVVKAVKAPRLLDGTPAAVEGRIQQFVSAADFLVSGTAVDASNATFVNGVIGDLAEGKRVVVHGTLSNGKVVATKLRFYRPDQDGEVRLIGLVSDFLSLQSFKVRGVATDASGAAFINGTADQLTSGRLVQIKGSAVGSLVTATSVEYLDSNLNGALLAGRVSDFVSTGSFKLGGQSTALADGARIINGSAASIVNGATLWAKGERNAGGVFVATTVFVVPNWIVATTQVAGTVTDPDATAGTFKLNGTLVTTSPATRYLGGDASGLLAGVRLVVTGKMQGGVLAAETINFARLNEACKAFKLEAVVYDHVSAGNFKLLGYQVDASGATFSGGTAADLADGRIVQACGDELPAGNALKADSIVFLTVR